MKTKRTAAQVLGKKVQQLLKQYRDNRDNQSTKHWDKDEDIQAVFDAANRVGAVWCEACAGTFWLGFKNKRFIQVDVDRYWRPKWCTSSK